MKTESYSFLFIGQRNAARAKGKDKEHFLYFKLGSAVRIDTSAFMYLAKMWSLSTVCLHI